jgi:beta-N-acetylhexosaminidase
MLLPQRDDSDSMRSPGDAASAVVVAAVEGTALTADERSFFETEAPAGVTLFRRNIAPRFAEVRSLIVELQATRPAGVPPLVMAVDQEGGRVARLRAPFPDAGPPYELAGGGQDEAALTFIENYGFALGAAARALGFNVDFAPCVDVRTPTTNDAIGDRAFGSTPEAVTRRAGVFLDGLQAAGVLGCLKHFPGQGAARHDTHSHPAVIDSSREALWARDLAPFRALIAAAPMVMVSHCTYAALDTQPASRSRAIIEDLLRRELGFDGVVVSDDMNMKAASLEDTAWPQAIVDAVGAGVDMLLVCRDLDRAKRALEALRGAAERDPHFASRLSNAARRVTGLRERLW